MSSVEYLREFVIERLTAAAEEIFGVFKNTIVEYEEEIDRQRRLLDVVRKPEIKLQRIELPQQHASKEKEEEVLTHQHICNQERNSSLRQESPQIKEEQEEVCTKQEGKQLGVKQEGKQLVGKQEGDQILKQESTAEENPVDKIHIKWVRLESDRPKSGLSAPVPL
ncbi:uncharacterized protein LOC116689013 isoform X1 [Etheostoma spectabile]|uniref:uncharacterized protein LOC116689013 isoform X1 n=1 Tax=Etheostoma spectabile TaxID=54343 RepID=UPI0013AFBE12|nr:uncharacterized protein LOC116689013 isoform X1 [Etheostoma spectabile]